MPLSVRRSSTRGTPRGLLGSSGSIVRYSKSARSYRLIRSLNHVPREDERPKVGYAGAMVDPIIKRTVERAVGLRGASGGDTGEVLAIYSNKSGEDVFIIERNGLRLLPDQRLVAYRDIEALNLDPQVKEYAEARTLSLSILGGEQLVLPIDGQQGKFLDIFPVHAFLRRRAHQHRNTKGAASA